MIARITVAVAILAVSVLAGGPATRVAQAAPVAVPAAAAPRAAQPAVVATGPAGAAAGDPAEDIRDIHGPIPLSPPRSSRWWGLAGAGLLAIAIIGIVLHARRRKPVLPPDQRALRALREAQTLVGGEADAFSVAVSEVVRAYVEDAFQLRASHRTTDELLADLMQDGSPVAGHRVELGDFLRRCDLVKFAAWSLQRAEMEAMLSSAEAFVRATAPGPTPRGPAPSPRRKEGVAVA